MERIVGLESSYTGHEGVIDLSAESIKMCDQKILVRGLDGYVMDLSDSYILKLKPGPFDRWMQRFRILHLDSLLALAGRKLEVQTFVNEELFGTTIMSGVEITRANENGSFDISYTSYETNPNFKAETALVRTGYVDADSSSPCPPMKSII